MTRRPPVRSLTAVIVSALQIVWLTVPGIAVADPADPEPPAGNDPVPAIPGLVIYRSSYPFAETVSRVQYDIGSVTTIDFARTAQWTGKELRPTTLIIGGNPGHYGTVLAASQRTAIDLPQKYLVWQASGGTVFVGYNSPEFVAAGGGIDTSSAALEGLRKGSAWVAAEASGSADPASDGSAGTSGPDLIEKTSDATVPDTIARYQAVFAQNAMFAQNTVPNVLTFDEGAAASNADIPVAPTVLTVTDDASISVPLVSAAQTMAIDLPLKFIAWQDDSGVHAAYPDIRNMAARHQVSGQDVALDKATAANDLFTNAAIAGPVPAPPAPPVAPPPPAPSGPAQ